MLWKLLTLSVLKTIRRIILKPGAYYNVIGWISLRLYKQTSVATKNSTAIANQILSPIVVVIRLYCSGNSRFLISIVYIAYLLVNPLATHYFGNSANSRQSLFSSASTYPIAKRLRYGAIYGVMCSALYRQLNRYNCVRLYTGPIKWRRNESMNQNYYHSF